MIFAIVFRMLRTLTGSTGADWRVRFRHARGATLRQYRRHFSCPIEFGHDRDCIEFPSRLLAQEIDHADRRYLYCGRSDGCWLSSPRDQYHRPGYGEEQRRLQHDD